jgi:hypothetical protein
MNPMDTLPPTHPTKDSFGYKCFSGQCPTLTVVNDPTSPGTTPNVFRITFPTSTAGGDSPSRFLAGDDFGGKRRLYSSVWVYQSPNWSNNGNANTKFVFARSTISDQGTPSRQNGYIHSTYGSYPYRGGFQTQCVTGACSSTNHNSLEGVTVPVGAWYRLEWLIEMGTPNVANGTAKLWRNGELIVNATNVMWTGTLEGAETQADANWSYLWVDPTYGGGGASPPESIYFQIDDWYTSVGD